MHWSSNFTFSSPPIHCRHRLLNWAGLKLGGSKTKTPKEKPKPSANEDKRSVSSADFSLGSQCTSRRCYRSIWSKLSKLAFFGLRKSGHTLKASQAIPAKKVSMYDFCVTQFEWDRCGCTVMVERVNGLNQSFLKYRSLLLAVFIWIPTVLHIWESLYPKLARCALWTPRKRSSEQAICHRRPY